MVLLGDDLPDGQIASFRKNRFVQPFLQKYFALSEARISRMVRAVLTRFKRGGSRSSRTLGEDAMDVSAQLTNAADADGEGVWS